MRIKLSSLGAACIALSAVACSPGSRHLVCRELRQPAAASTPAATSPFRGSVFTIVMENKSASQILDGDEAPYIRSLADTFAVAGNYRSTQVFPSEPNYIWMVSGQNFGILDNDPPADNRIASRSHVADQIEAAGLTWRSYQESMGEPCLLEARYPYDPKHNPFVFFDDINGWDGRTFQRPERCLQNVVDYSQLDADLASGNLPRYVFITPDLKNDMHDEPIGVGDAWLSREVPKILASKAWQDGGVLFLTWDEGGGHNSDDPAMIVISPLASPHHVSKVRYDTTSYLKTVQAILGLEPLPCDPDPDSVSTMADLFRVPLPDMLSATGTR